MSSALRSVPCKLNNEKHEISTLDNYHDIDHETSERIV